MGCAISFQHLSPFKGAEHVGISVLMLRGWHGSPPGRMSAGTMAAGTFPRSETTLVQSGSAITYCTLIIHKIKQA